MSNKLSLKLQKEAEESAKFRGHTFSKAILRRHIHFMTL